MKGPKNNAKSTPDPPGPPGLRNSDPILADGSAAGMRTRLKLVFAPFGLL